MLQLHFGYFFFVTGICPVMYVCVCACLRACVRVCVWWGAWGTGWEMFLAIKQLLKNFVRKAAYIC